MHSIGAILLPMNHEMYYQYKNMKLPLCTFWGYEGRKVSIIYYKYIFWMLVLRTSFFAPGLKYEMLLMILIVVLYNKYAIWPISIFVKLTWSIITWMRWIIKVLDLRLNLFSIWFLSTFTQFRIFTFLHYSRG